MKQSLILVVPQDVLADVINAIQPFGVTIKRIAPTTANGQLAV